MQSTQSDIQSLLSCGNTACSHKVKVACAVMLLSPKDHGCMNASAGSAACSTSQPHVLISTLYKL